MNISLMRPWWPRDCVRLWVEVDVEVVDVAVVVEVVVEEADAAEVGADGFDVDAPPNTGW